MKRKSWLLPLVLLGLLTLFFLWGLTGYPHSAQQHQGEQPGFPFHSPSSSLSRRRLTRSAAARLTSTSTADRRNTPWSMG